MTETEWYQATDRDATIHKVANGVVVVAALVAGDGIDLVITPPGGVARTVQLTTDEAHELAAAIDAAADESATL